MTVASYQPVKVGLVADDSIRLIQIHAELFAGITAAIFLFQAGDGQRSVGAGLSISFAGNATREQ